MGWPIPSGGQNDSSPFSIWLVISLITAVCQIGQCGGVVVPDDQRLQHGASRDAEDVGGNCRSLGTTGRFWAQKSLACRTRRSTYEARGVAAAFGSHALVTASRTPLACEVGYSHVRRHRPPDPVQQTGSTPTIECLLKAC